MSLILFYLISSQVIHTSRLDAFNMVSYRFVAMAGMAGMVAALPLNINLGAYSPALVVGQFSSYMSRGLRVASPRN